MGYDLFIANPLYDVAVGRVMNDVKMANGKYQKTFIEVRKNRKTLEFWSFYDHLEERYKRSDTDSDTLINKLGFSHHNS